MKMAKSALMYRPGNHRWMDRRLKTQEEILGEAHRHFTKEAEAEFPYSYVSEWLLDNYHIIRETWRQIRESMPKSFYRQLPKRTAHPLKGMPRIYGIALDALGEAQGELKIDSLKEFIERHPEGAELETGEIWALPVMLRLGALENLTRAVGLIRGEEDPESPVPDPDMEKGRTTSDEAMVSHSILTLRAIEAHDWKAFFEAVSPVEKILGEDPAGVYNRMDFNTRDMYRKAVETLARGSRKGETQAAREAVRLAEDASAENSRGARTFHVGYYLMDQGRKELETRLDFRPSLKLRIRRMFLSRPTPLYLGSMWALGLILLTALICFGYKQGASWLQLFMILILVLIPAGTAATTIANWLFTRILSPRMLPKLDFQEAIPEDCRSIVVIPGLLSDAEEIEGLLRQLELHYLGNGDPNLHFALLTDLDDAPEKEMPQDRERIAQAIAGIESLNRKYGKSLDRNRKHLPFYLFHRERLWNRAERKWMGWERKRGKLEEFNRMATRSGKTSYGVRIGDTAPLSNIRYVITLDSDTVLPRETVHRLIGTLAHPLNQAEFDPRTGEVVSGYTILQPRTEIRPVSANRSLFTRIFSGNSGLDLYSFAVSDVYQDLFGEGIYTGKGIYDLKAFERVMGGRVPENTLLSHDLFEGLYTRVGLASDIFLLEEYPPGYPAYVKRLHRWVRGDWQLLPWLLLQRPDADSGTDSGSDSNAHSVRRACRLSLIGWWKIFDNLIRSLFQPGLLALLTGTWLLFPGSMILWTLLLLLMSAAPLALQAATGLPEEFLKVFRPQKEGQGRISLGERAASFRVPASRWLLLLAFLPYETLVTLDAVIRTLYRIFISRRNLLEWTTSAHINRNFAQDGDLLRFWRQMWIGPVAALGLGFSLAVFHPGALFSALPLLSAWFLSPHIAHWISRPQEAEPVALDTGQRYQIRRIARRTWFFFERFAGPEDSWLPPDHFQESPLGLPAHRTSPTNIGLMLLSTLGAYDLGYIGLPLLSIRLKNTFDALERMEQYRGHFLNWYDTRNLSPLPPRYVSTVDSGNLAGSLLALRQGCLALEKTPILRWERWQGLLDTIDVLDEIETRLTGEAIEAARPLQEQWVHIREHVLSVQNDPNGWPSLLIDMEARDLPELIGRLQVLIDGQGSKLNRADMNSLRIWTERIHYQLRTARREIERLAPWVWMLDDVPEIFRSEPTAARHWQGLKGSLPLMPHLRDVESICDSGIGRLRPLVNGLKELPESEERDQGLAWCEKLHQGFVGARSNTRDLLEDLAYIAGQSEKLVEAMDFTFLYNPRRHIFRIGCNVDAGVSDSNHYDLLASEARIASLVAIAKGDVSHRHWLHLSRPLTQIDGIRGLLSWSGSMFEYLMPIMMMREEHNTLLGQSNRAAVDRQIAYGKQMKKAWGISESAYYQFDAGMHYQYRAFGVPGLGYKRGLETDLVIAPYASMLALPIRPKAVMENVAALIREGALGDYGFYESTDHTPSRMALGEEQALIRSFYSHHQGMIFLSIVNYLTADESGSGKMVNRFHSDPRIQSVEMLLQERVPNRAPLERMEEEAGLREIESGSKITLNSWPAPVTALFPQVHLLSNGRYSLFITSAGAGYSIWKDMALTRWRGDTTLEEWGIWIYVRDEDSGRVCSATYQPAARTGTKTEAHFSPHKADFRTRFDDIVLHTEITVPPEDSVEIRRITITNQSDRNRKLFIASYAEAVLAPADGDRRHPAFNKLFIESRYLEQANGLLFRRRPRSAEEPPIFMLHGLTPPPEMPATRAFESDRFRFIGRGRTLHDPLALQKDGPGLTRRDGATLDPVMSLGQMIELEPNQMIRMAFFTLAGDDAEAAARDGERYQSWAAIDRAFEEAGSQSRIELRQLELESTDLSSFQKLLSPLLYPHPAFRADPGILSANTLGQPGLWPYAISGDYPILLVRIGNEEDISLIHQVLKAHTYWRNRNLKIDLVILNLKETGYSQEIQGQIHRLLTRTGSEGWLNRRGGIFLLRWDQMGEAEQILLQTSARVVLDGEKGTLDEQLAGGTREPNPLPTFHPAQGPMPEPAPPLLRPDNLRFDNGLGGFTPDGREYLIHLDPGESTPAPWINVIANPDFGFLVSESGSGSTWAINSGENRLTPWGNDPVSDPPGEALYLRDEETADIWSPTPLPAGASEPYQIRHGAGYTIFKHQSRGLLQEVCLFVPPQDPVKIIRLRLENTGNHPRRITATYYAEWVLGPDREVMGPFILSEYAEEVQALFARNPYNTEFGERVAFLSADRKLHSLTASREEFLGRMGSRNRPAALERIGLGNTTHAGVDPCAAVQIHINLPPGGVEEVSFLLGQGADRADAERVVRTYQAPERIDEALKAATALWDEVLGAVTVRTPDAAMDILLNRWLVYQNLSCRIWGRSALYQSSGAFGFRDQLQDVMAILNHRPDLAREHILRAARHQFEEGDVLHWWHPPSGRGVRTRISDDLLWLPYVTAKYAETTGDLSILSEEIPFLRGKPLEAEEEERYGQYDVTKESFSLYEHCRRAIRKGATRGSHGMPLIGGGDWNDGMNRVGIEGKGESVWLGWFLHAVLTDFSEVSRNMDREEDAEDFLQDAQAMRQSLEESGWDGNWYLRGFYDDGTPLGSSGSEECRIDAIAQSWAVLSGAGDPSRAAQAMNAVTEQLVKQEDQLIKLFTPPFDKTSRDPGYIKGYPPGIRENGGQYTHAATWTVWALAQLGQGDQAHQLFRMLNPIGHGDTRENVRQYQVEPYVIAADVYGIEPHVGRGGWTWYTGSGGWMYRLGLEAILGLRREGDRLRIFPSIPRDWGEFSIDYRYGQAVYHIHVINPEGLNVGVKEIRLNNEVLPQKDIPLLDEERQYEVEVRMG